jgi:NADPH:quinone reductase-like Zn-dependent oxidoreductase
VGDRVWVRLTDNRYGSIAEYTLTTVDQVSIMPSNLSFAEAAAVPLAAVTALQALRQMGTNENSKVFITGGAGGVGTYAIQIAKLVFGAKTIVTTASPGAGTELCTRVGATKVVDYRSQKFETELAGQEFDVAFDCTGESHKVRRRVRKLAIWLAFNRSRDEIVVAVELCLAFAPSNQFPNGSIRAIFFNAFVVSRQSALNEVNVFKYAHLYTGL